MSRSPLVAITINIPRKAKETLERQAKERGCAWSLWAGQVFDLGFAAVCAREKSMPITDKDLDAIVGATFLLWSAEFDTSEIAKGLGISEPTVVRIMDTWREYRRASE